jgi:hypothetical protein
MYEKAIDKGHGLASFNLGMRGAFSRNTSVKVKVHGEELAGFMRTAVPHPTLMAPQPPGIWKGRMVSNATRQRR